MVHYLVQSKSTQLTVMQLKLGLFGVSESSNLAFQKKPPLMGGFFIDCSDIQLPWFGTDQFGDRDSS
jgi:hypothetical protein